MQIPKYLKEKLEKDPSLFGCVTSSLAEFEPWLASSGLPFFPEYTEHGPKHIEHVLETTEALISSESWDVITAGDAATLVLAVLLHDMAMHLSEDSFLHLIRSDNVHLIKGFDDISWRLLWTDFISEARRFDGRKLNALFGNTSPVSLLPTNSLAFTKRDRLLVGEFLRRHHSRLAHEIALFGVPTSQKDKLQLKDVPNYLADLAGLVARSHGLPLRSCFNYLKTKYNLREFKGVHAVFHMALVRVADYLQADAERAPQQILKVKQLCSPVSQGEWNAHHAISDIRLAEEDPEAIFIDSRPKDAKTYLRIIELLNGLQTEIDASWAAIGEVYGRYTNEGLDKLGLKLRRVRSNLDDEATFAESVEFVPAKAAFHTANAELLSLLIGPLYGNGPEFGIRELLQNAVDAVLELGRYQELHPECKDIKLIDQDSDIVIALDKDENGSSWITVSDRGTGMTLETIRGYFLKVGASFRNSETWHKDFDDSTGKSSVMRSGRFGIGVLASFLLGEEVHVSTRFVNAAEAEGIAFSASIDTDVIELRKSKLPVGTTIRIRVQNIIADKLEDMIGAGKPEHMTGFLEFTPSWDWYCLDKPSVQYLINNKIHKQNCVLPSADQSLPYAWRRLKVDGYSDVQWTYARVPFLTCNGFIIMRRPAPDYKNFGTWHFPRSAPSWGPIFLSSAPTEERNADGSAVYEHTDANDQYRFTMPNVSVFDFDARLPLNLQRTELTQENYPFQEEILDSIIRDFIAYTLVSAPTRLPESTKGMHIYNSFPGNGKFFHPGISFNPLSESFAPFWFYTNQGISLADRWHLRHVELESIMIYFEPRSDVSFIGEDFSLPFPEIKEHEAVLRLSFQQGSINIPNYAEGTCSFGDPSSLYMNPLAVIGQRILLPKGMRKTQLSEEAKYETEWESDNCILLRQGECPKALNDILKSSSQLEEHCNVGIQGAFVSEMYLAKQQPEVRKSLIAEAWQKIVGDPIIPYNQEDRRNKFANAYKILAPYIAAYEIARTENNDQSEVI